jgi:hypothetical protein
VKKRVLAIVLTAVLVLSLGLVFATPAGASPGTATFGDDPSDWEKTENRITSDTTELGSAAAWDDAAWGDWVTPAWDGPSSGIHGDTISYWVANDTWVTWSNGGDNWVDHTDQWFRTSIDIPCNWIVTSAKLVYKYNNNIIPVNDDLYVYVDDDYVAAGGTAGVGWVQAYLPIGVTPPPDPTYGSNTFVAAIDPYSYAIAPETGWYINGGLDLPPELFSPGSHDIHVLGEEFDISGGLGHLIIQVEYEEITIVDLTPPNAENPVGTEHCVTATVDPPIRGIEVSFEVTGANPTCGPLDPTVMTLRNGQATFCYIGSNVGTDTIRAYIDSNCDGDWETGESNTTVTKEWYCQFLTGGGNINVDSGKKKAWTFGGNVANLIDGSVRGQFNIVDHANKETWHCHNDFASLIFSGGPTASPPANLDHAQFVGTFTSNKGETKYLQVQIWDDQEPGRDFDEIRVWYDTDNDPTTIGWTRWFWGIPIDGGNLQVHDKCKGGVVFFPY